MKTEYFCAECFMFNRQLAVLRNGYDLRIPSRILLLNRPNVHFVVAKKPPVVTPPYPFWKYTSRRRKKPWVDVWPHHAMGLLKNFELTAEKFKLDLGTTRSRIKADGNFPVGRTKTTTSRSTVAEECSRPPKPTFQTHEERHAHKHVPKELLPINLHGPNIPFPLTVLQWTREGLKEYIKEEPKPELPRSLQLQSWEVETEGSEGKWTSEELRESVLSASEELWGSDVEFEEVDKSIVYMKIEEEKSAKEDEFEINNKSEGNIIHQVEEYVKEEVGEKKVMFEELEEEAIMLETTVAEETVFEESTEKEKLLENLVAEETQLVEPVVEEKVFEGPVVEEIELQEQVVGGNYVEEVDGEDTEQEE